MSTLLIFNNLILSPIMREDEIFRDMLWTEYYQRKTAHMCSRCGSYTEYEIHEDDRPITLDKFSLLPEEERKKYNFYIIDYYVTTKHVENPNNLGSEQFYDICKPCQDHILGRGSRPLSKSLDDTEKRLQKLKAKEQNRRFFQDDKIKAVQKKIAQIRKCLGELTADEETLNNGK